MSEKTDDEKESQVTTDTKSEQPKKPPDLDDTISRLLRRKDPGAPGKDDSVH